MFIIKAILLREIQAYDAERQMAYSYNPTGSWETQAGIPVDKTGYAGLNVS
ncbi:MAG: hypothetical protein U5K00_16165 [Melioribacteraceae bacterium]|nr:hypothetical protein [Melioribacteraceae bacterium]